MLNAKTVVSWIPYPDRPPVLVYPTCAKLILLPLDADAAESIVHADAPPSESPRLLPHRLMPVFSIRERTPQ